MELVRRQLEADGRLTSGDDIQVALVADLQELQKQEAEELLEEIVNKVRNFGCFWNFEFFGADRLLTSSNIGASY